MNIHRKRCKMRERQRGRMMTISVSCLQLNTTTAVKTLDIRPVSKDSHQFGQLNKRGIAKPLKHTRAHTHTHTKKREKKRKKSSSTYGHACLLTILMAEVNNSVLRVLSHAAETANTHVVVSDHRANRCVLITQMTISALEQEKRI